MLFFREKYTKSLVQTNPIRLIYILFCTAFTLCDRYYWEWTFIKLSFEKGISSTTIANDSVQSIQKSIDLVHRKRKSWNIMKWSDSLKNFLKIFLGGHCDREDILLWNFVHHIKPRSKSTVCVHICANQRSFIWKFCVSFEEKKLQAFNSIWQVKQIAISAILITKKESLCVIWERCCRWNSESMTKFS